MSFFAKGHQLLFYVSENNSNCFMLIHISKRESYPKKLVLTVLLNKILGDEACDGFAFYP